MRTPKPYDPHGDRPAKHYPTPTDEDRATMLALHEQGLSLRKIAKETGWSFTTVGSHLRQMNADTDRSKTAEATAARVRQLSERRVGLAEDLMNTAENMHERVWDEYTMVSNGPEGAQLIKLDEPPIPDQAHGIKGISSAVETVDRLLSGAVNPEADEAKNVITNIFDGLEKVFAGGASTVGLGEDDHDHDYDIRTDPDQQVTTAPAEGEIVNEDEWEWEEYTDYYTGEDEDEQK